MTGSFCVEDFKQFSFFHLAIKTPQGMKAIWSYFLPLKEEAEEKILLFSYIPYRLEDIQGLKKTILYIWLGKDLVKIFNLGRNS